VAVETRHRNRRQSGRYQWSARAFTFPALALVAVLLYLPFLWTAYLSFTRYRGLGTPEWRGLENYQEMFANPQFVSSAVVTLAWVVGTITIPVGLGLLIAVLTYDKGRLGSLFRLPFLLPYAVSGVGVGVMWSFVLRTNGALTQAIEALGLPGAELRWLLDTPLNTFVMIMAAAWQGVGVNALLFVIGLQSIPRETIDAGRVDGASGWSMFSRILWPHMRPLTTVVVGLAMVASLKTFDIVWSMTRGGPGRVSDTLALMMYRESFVLSNFGFAGAIAIFLTVVTVIASIIYLRRQLSERFELN
jgi:ABC-type sugar transport system permease subunit